MFYHHQRSSLFLRLSLASAVSPLFPANFVSFIKTLINHRRCCVVVVVVVGVPTTTIDDTSKHPLK
jgi:hypothetical protein